jgi:hypothetical protein
LKSLPPAAAAMRLSAKTGSNVCLSLQHTMQTCFRMHVSILLLAMMLRSSRGNRAGECVAVDGLQARPSPPRTPPPPPLCTAPHRSSLAPSGAVQHQRPCRPRLHLLFSIPQIRQLLVPCLPLMPLPASQSLFAQVRVRVCGHRGAVAADHARLFRHKHSGRRHRLPRVAGRSPRRPCNSMHAL